MGDVAQIPGSSVQKKPGLPALRKAAGNRRAGPLGSSLPLGTGQAGEGSLPGHGGSGDETSRLRSICPLCSSDPLALFPQTEQVHNKNSLN